MTRETIALISAAGAEKQEFSKNFPCIYLCRAVIAGFFIVVGTLLSNLCRIAFFEESLGAAALLGAASFSIALILIVLLGGELFTGANLVMSLSLFEKRANPTGVLRVWALCYLGNLLGIVLLCGLIAASGSQALAIGNYISQGLEAKLASPWYTLFIKGILCNFLVCMGVFSGFHLKTETGKVLVIICLITTFILAGFEHSIANLASFSLTAFLLPDPDFGAMLWNLLWVTLGNVIGGTVLCGLPLSLSAKQKSKKC